MKRLVALLLAPLVWGSGQDWIEVRSGPFEIFTPAGARTAGRAMAYCEQLRNALELSLGRTDLVTVWPIRIVLFGDGRARARYPSGFVNGRDAHLVARTAGAPPPLDFAAGIVRILLRDNTAALPQSIEYGLIALFSTLEVKGLRVTLGAPPPPAGRNLDWARLQMLATSPDYSGRLRVMLGNLARGAELAPSALNAFNKPIEAIDQEAAAYLAKGIFQTIAVSARPIDAERDYYPRRVPPERISAILAELAGAPLEEPTPGARTLVERAAREPDPAKARRLLEQAIRLNPRWAEPHARLASLETATDAKIARLKAAAKLDPRGGYEALARAAEAAERQRLEEERERSLERARQQELARIRAAEEKAIRGLTPLPAGEKVEAWWDGPQPDRRLEGLLEHVDCVRGAARLLVRDSGHTTTQRLIREPEKVALRGTSGATLACGPQRPPRRVVIEYFAKPDRQWGTAGEVATVEFR